MSSGEGQLKQAEVRRDMYEGFGDTMSLALEFVVVPLLFGFLGHVADDRLGTGPVIMLVLGLLGFVGVAIRAFYGYRYRMARAEKDMPWNR